MATEEEREVIMRIKKLIAISDYSIRDSDNNHNPPTQVALTSRLFNWSTEEMLNPVPDS